ncbi:hypothetical protein MCOR27_002283 [Pyricularia oryzae]|uniref:Uncharacterized protein n=2 Tax=Pyricularia TaxID=48558 RepID=A0ABQ8NI88_PYRGI|nr:hypothetical protein MCOR01_006175 [Pyricularia oryzae]KAI6297498.1 hypothetical protein MCOR33_006226 [Pyricularia grisea]KAI6258426.1 hypothetical protein MCOR19_005227 [Pyricularia oryzae]KAI6270834.1 hypothetical protein MCOR26_008050 [Pyricularia oryzae]KAI6285626.1 hypothetical protein MCOR27_002283 [Pyricularia oryzae]
MDVTSLLIPAGAAGRMPQQQQQQDPLNMTPTPSIITNTTDPSTGVVTPQSEKEVSRSNSESRTPNRSRTPWDAGGYSLPLTLDTKLIRTQLATKPVLYGESPTQEHHHMEPSSPHSLSKHKFSDSHSSLASSYTTASSNNSGTHSRISSLSTVSEFQPMNHLINEFSSLEAKMSDENDRNSSSNSNATAIHDDPNSRVMMGNDSDPLVDPALQPLSPFTLNSTSMELQNSAVMAHSNEGDNVLKSEQPRSHRAQSPSDAILFNSNPTNVREPVMDMGRRTSDTLAYGYQPGHKRSASAPDFPAVRARYQPSGGFAAPIVEPPTYSPSMSYNQSFNMFDQPRRVSSPSDEDGYGEETASSATRSDQTVPTTASTVPATQPWENPTVEGPEEDRDAEDPGAASDYDEESTPRCLFGVRPCDTGSQLRKAVSHIFGRNKLCTRQIPDNAWVHYCRKHYQRSRYRAGPDYSLTQIGLVIRQINKIRNWSDYNVAHNRSSGVVTSWRLQLRKREEKRRETKQQLSQVGKKRRRVDGEGYEEDEEDDEGQPGSASRNSDFATQQGQAPPQWLIEKLGDGYTTDEVLGIARRLKDELEAGTTRLIPDIEILPNITSDRAEEPKPRTKPQRRAPPQPSRVPPSRSRLPPYGYGHRSTLSESSRGASHLDHLQDVVGMSHWDNPSKRQRGTEYGQVRNPWGQQPTTTLPIRSSNDPSAFGGSLGTASHSQNLSTGGYGYGMSMQRPSPGFPTPTSLTPSASWDTSTNRLPNNQYGSGTMQSAYPQLGSGSSTASSTMSYGYGTSYSQPATQQSFYSGSPYGSSAVPQASAQPRTSNLYGDAWGNYNQTGTDNTFNQSGRMNGQSPARTHQRHVSAPWPNSSMNMTPTYQFTNPGAVPQFATNNSALDPSLGGSHQRRSSMPHNQMGTVGRNSGLNTPQMTPAIRSGSGSEHETSQSYDPHRPPSSSGRYDYATTHR